ncbi:collagen-like protein mcl1 [Colletotrichum karsti]|uniref:Collagen-like protein mcl1 n=1 Tax=Colletotrichum karsti TaxID=1095194 RepID=A0A9P6IH29_9PEZI|nr:collagen-like protein mcl1 [Colletotrichum karsti]KAF9882026.1 collagen-like protein mcl1 [Colletotrichum karsti]
MKQTTISSGFFGLSGLAVLLSTPALASRDSTPNMLDARQDKPPYQDVVCKPETNGQLPPCVQIENIEVACAPNGTQSIYYEAHAQCMCGGSFFAEKLACERCLNVHGLRSERDLAYYSGILASASNALCTGTPTADFASIYSSIAIAATPVTTGGTATSDRAVSNTAISLYYTASGPQGPGSITGAAASATNTGGSTTAAATTTATRSTSSDDDSSTTAATVGSGTASGSAATTSSSGSGAMPTLAAGGLVAGAAGIAGLAVFAGL